MKIISEKMQRKDLLDEAECIFEDEMIKAVVDIDRRIIAFDAELHADLEAFLLNDGSDQKSLWGINFYPLDSDEDFIEYDSLINIRPRQNNRSRGVEDPKLRTGIEEVVMQWIE